MLAKDGITYLGSATSSNMKIRNADIADLEQIVKIYNAAIPGRMATADTDPVTVESRLAWFRGHSCNHYPLWVLEGQEGIAGWLSFRSFYGRPAYHITAEIGLYIAPMYHRQGIGQQLLESAISHSPHLGIQTLLGFIFAHNTPSLSLFQKLGFQQWGYLPKVAILDNMKRDLIILGYHVNY